MEDRAKRLAAMMQAPVNYDHPVVKEARRHVKTAIAYKNAGHPNTDFLCFWILVKVIGDVRSVAPLDVNRKTATSGGLMLVRNILRDLERLDIYEWYIEVAPIYIEASKARRALS